MKETRKTYLKHEKKKENKELKKNRILVITDWGQTRDKLLKKKKRIKRLMKQEKNRIKNDKKKNKKTREEHKR